MLRLPGVLPVSEINVVPQFLTNIASRIRTVEDELRRCSTRAESSLNTAPTVARANQELGKRWDQRRNELADALGSLANSFITVRDKFETTDSELAADFRDM